MIAALQMYDWPEVSDRTDGFWCMVAEALRAEGVPAPQTLSRPAEKVAPWRDPALLLGQTCGLPYVSGQCGGAILVGRPVYAAEGCGDGTYRSALVCRAGEEGPLAAFRGHRAAVNEFGSQSGCNALADAVLPLGGDGFFGAVALSGSHRRSALMVADGMADIAAIDSVAWALFAENEPAAHRRLSVIGWTRECPALPFITAGANSGRVAVLCRALSRAARPSAPAGVPIGIRPADEAAYDPIRQMAARVRGMRLAPDTPSLPAAA